MDQALARTALYDFGTAHYNAASLAVLGAPGELRYKGGPDFSTPDNGKYWAKITSQVVDEYQESLRLNTKRWCSIGLVFVQLFAPVTDTHAQVNLDKIAELVRNAFRLHQTEIEFTNAVINDNVAAEPNWLRANVSSTFTYRQFM